MEPSIGFEVKLAEAISQLSKPIVGYHRTPSLLIVKAIEHEGFRGHPGKGHEGVDFATTPAGTAGYFWAPYLIEAQLPQGALDFSQEVQVPRDQLPEIRPLRWGIDNSRAQSGNIAWFPWANYPLDKMKSVILQGDDYNLIEEFAIDVLDGHWPLGEQRISQLIGKPYKLPLRRPTDWWAERSAMYE